MAEPVPAGRRDPGQTAAPPARLSASDALPGLGIALCFAISAIFVRNGLEGLPSPLLGVTLGSAASTLAYAPWLL